MRWFVVASLVVMMGSGCEAWECGYGGPGCTDARLDGFCHAHLVVGEEREGAFVYSDDTNTNYEAVAISIEVDEPSVLEVERVSPPNENYPGEGDATFRFVAKEVGEARVVVELEYWDHPSEIVFTVHESEASFPEEVQESSMSCVTLKARELATP